MKQFSDYLEVVTEMKKGGDKMKALKLTASSNLPFIKEYIKNISDVPKLEMIQDYESLVLYTPKTLPLQKQFAQDVIDFMSALFEDQKLTGTIYFPDGIGMKANLFMDYAKGVNSGVKPMQTCLALLNNMLQKFKGDTQEIKDMIGF